MANLKIPCEHGVFRPCAGAARGGARSRPNAGGAL